MVIATAVLFIITEPIAGQVIEPVLYGQHTGLSPVAIVISTLFWALLWGPIGLLLATPLTVRLVVLGRHIEALGFIEVLLGDEPALAPEERFYQRLLATDTAEAVEQAEVLLQGQSLLTYFDDVPMKALALAQYDAAHGKLPHEQQNAIRNTMGEVVEELDKGPASNIVKFKVPEIDDPPMEIAQERVEQLPIMCIASRSPLDEAAAMLLGRILEDNGLRAIVEPYVDLRTDRLKFETANAAFVCFSYFGAGDRPAHVRILIRRLRRIMPNAKILVGYWLLGDDKQKVTDWKLAVGADFAATTLAEALAVCIEENTAPGTGRHHAQAS